TARPRGSCRAPPPRSSRDHRDRGARAAEGAHRDVHGPGALRAGGPLRPLGGGRRGAVNGLGRAAASLALLALAWPAHADDREKTIASLADRTVELPPGGTIADGSERARESYRAFLDLVSEDPGLRAEAMRRLAELELEAAQAGQA